MKAIKVLNKIRPRVTDPYKACTGGGTDSCSMVDSGHCHIADDICAVDQAGCSYPEAGKDICTYYDYSSCGGIAISDECDSDFAGCCFLDLIDTCSFDTCGLGD